MLSNFKNIFSSDKGKRSLSLYQVATSQSEVKDGDAAQNKQESNNIPVKNGDESKKPTNNLPEGKRMERFFSTHSIDIDSKEDSEHSVHRLSPDLSNNQSEKIDPKGIIDSFFMKLNSMNEDDLYEVEKEDENVVNEEARFKHEQTINYLIDLKNPQIAGIFCDCILNCIKDQSHPESRIALFYSSVFLLYALEYHFHQYQSTVEKIQQMEEKRQVKNKTKNIPLPPPPPLNSYDAIKTCTTLLIKLVYVIRELTSINSFHQIKFGQKKHGNLFLQLLNQFYEDNLSLTIVLCEIIRNIVIKDSNKMNFGEIGCCEVFMKLLKFYLRSLQKEQQPPSQKDKESNDKDSNRQNESTRSNASSSSPSQKSPADGEKGEDPLAALIPPNSPLRKNERGEEQEESSDENKSNDQDAVVPTTTKEAVLGADEPPVKPATKPSTAVSTTTNTAVLGAEPTDEKNPAKEAPPATSLPPVPTPIDAILILCSSILNLSANNFENKKVLGELGCCEIMIQILVYSAFTTVQQQQAQSTIIIDDNNNTDDNSSLSIAISLVKIVCGTIQNLSVYEKNKTRFGEIGGCEALIYVLLIYMENPMITWEIFSAIRNVSLNNDNNLQLFGHLGTLELLTKSFIMHMNNPDVVKQICGALRRLGFYQRRALKKTTASAAAAGGDSQKEASNNNKNNNETGQPGSTSSTAVSTNIPIPPAPTNEFIRAGYTLQQLIAFVWNKKFSLFERYKKLYNEEILCETLLDALSKYLQQAILMMKTNPADNALVLYSPATNGHTIHRPATANAAGAFSQPVTPPSSSGQTTTTTTTHSSSLYYLASTSPTSLNTPESSTIRELVSTIKCLGINDDYHPFFELDLLIPLLYQVLEIYPTNHEIIRELCGAINVITSKSRSKKIAFIRYIHPATSSSFSLLLVKVYEENLFALKQATTGSSANHYHHNHPEDLGVGNIPPFHLEIMKELCRVFKNFAIEDEGKELLSSFNICSLLIEGLETSLIYPDIIVVICSSILNLSANSRENKMKFGTEKCFTMLINILLYYLSHHEIIKCICGVIKNLVVTGSNKELFASLNGCQVLFACLTTYYSTVTSNGNPNPSNPNPTANPNQVPPQGGSTTAALIRRDSSVFGPILDANTSSKLLVIEILEAIWNISLLNANKIVIGQIGGCEILIELLHYYYKHNKDITRIICGILKTLSIESYNHDKIGGHKGCQIFIKLLSKYYNNSEILKVILFILYQIITPSFTTSAAMISTATEITNSTTPATALNAINSMPTQQLPSISPSNSFDEAQPPSSPSNSNNNNNAAAMSGSPEENNKRLFGELDGCEKLILIFLNKNLIYSDLEIIKLLNKIIQQLTYNNSYNRKKFLSNGCAEIIVDVLKRLPKVNLPAIRARRQQQQQAMKSTIPDDDSDIPVKGGGQLIDGQQQKEMVLGSEEDLSSALVIPKSDSDDNPNQQALAGRFALLEAEDEKGSRLAQWKQQRILSLPPPTAPAARVSLDDEISPRTLALKPFHGDSSEGEEEEVHGGEEDIEGGSEDVNSKKKKMLRIADKEESSSSSTAVVKKSTTTTMTLGTSEADDHPLSDANIRPHSDGVVSLDKKFSSSSSIATTTTTSGNPQQPIRGALKRSSSMKNGGITEDDLQYFTPEEREIYEKNLEIKRILKQLIEKLSKDYAFKKKFEEIGVHKYLVEVMRKKSRVSFLSEQDNEDGDGEDNHGGRKSISESVTELVEDYQKRQRFSDQRFSNVTILL